MREKILSKFTNFDEAISFGQVFRINLYNALQDLKKVDEEEAETTHGVIDMENLSFVMENPHAGVNKLLGVIGCLWILF